MRMIAGKALMLLLFAGCTQATSGEGKTTKAEAAAPVAAPKGDSNVIVDHVLESLEGDKVELANYRGKALLIVNVASECGYTPQYSELESLYQKYKERGLVVVGIPSNDFGGQEPGSAAEIRNFCDTRYRITFPMMAKVHAKGEGIAPIYRTLTEETPDGIRGEVRWNFTKFLIDPEGAPVARFESKVKPLSDEVVRAVEAVLPAG